MSSFRKSSGVCIVSTVLTVSSFASGSSKCLDKIIQNQGWQSVSSSEAQCMQTALASSDGFKALCTFDQSGLSVKYAAYAGYQANYNMALKSCIQSTDPSVKGIACSKVQDIEQDWRVFGYRDQVSSDLQDVYAAKSDCETN